MQEQVQTILEVLSQHGIEHDPATLVPHHAQGIMSAVYTISSGAGRLIIHYVASSPTQARFRPFEKLPAVSRFLRAIPGVPAAHVLLAFKLPHHYVVVQHMLPGAPAGGIALKDGAIMTQWHAPADQFERELETVVASIHAAPLEGFGYLIEKDGVLRGSYDSWEGFLTAEIPQFIEGLEAADAVNGVVPDALAADTRAFFERVLPVIAPLERASLVSCDIFNPSNILVDGGKVTGIVDWEWAFAADPAWEFAYYYPYSLTHYFAERPEFHSEDSQARFRLRMHIYEFLLLFMWTYGTSGAADPSVFLGCRARYKKKMEEAPAFLRDLPQTKL